MRILSDGIHFAIALLLNRTSENVEEKMTTTTGGDSVKVDQPSARGRAVDASRLTRERMLKAMRVLESALAKAAPHRETAWRTAVVTALGALERTMQDQSAELCGDEGLLADLLLESPRLDNGIDALRREQADLVRQTGSLREEFLSSDEDHLPNIADMRQRLARLLTALRDFQARETDLIYEAIQVDIGAAD